MRPHNGTATSKAAAKVAKTITGHDRIMYCLRNNNRGLTREVIAHMTGMNQDTVNARLNELGHMGLVKALAETATLQSGHGGLMFVTAATSHGRPLADWPKPKTDWKRRALAAEAELAKLRAEA